MTRTDARSRLIAALNAGNRAEFEATMDEIWARKRLPGWLSLYNAFLIFA